MKTLLILRHAKSSWSEPGMSDHDRPLNARGKRDAPRIGQLIQDENLVPDRIVTSTAKRARKTAAKVAEHCGFPGEVERESQMYLANPDTYLAFLRELDDSVKRILIVGHNPGLEDLVDLLTGQEEAMPTATLAHVQFDLSSWKELPTNGSARLVDLWRPRDLEPAE